VNVDLMHNWRYIHGVLLVLSVGLTAGQVRAQGEAVSAGAASMAPTAESAYQDCVVVVLDASGSMGDLLGQTGRNKMEAAKDALGRVLAKLPPSTRVGILVFAGDNVSTPWIWPLGKRGSQTEMAAAIDPIRSGGGTPLGMFLKLGADALLEQRDKQYGYGSYRLLVVTDGEATDQHLVERYAPDIVARGISLDLIGVDMAQDHTLKNLAHSYRRADDPGSLRRAVQEVFAEVSTTSASAAGGPAESAFELLAGIEPELALAAISALAGSGNHAIGEAPPEPSEQEASGGGQPTPGTQRARDANEPSGRPSSADDGDSAIPWKIVLLGAVAAAVMLLFRRKKST
jgi:uncharacterized protein YegL